MKLLQRLLAYLSLGFGLYYLYVLIQSLATQWALFLPLPEIPLDVLVYLYYALFVVMAGITFLQNDKYYIFASLFLLMTVWILLLPQFFVPTVAILVIFIFFQLREHPIKNKLAFLIISYVVLGFSPLLGYLLLMYAWGWVGETILRTQKRGI
jgi:hypothetical protein